MLVENLDAAKSLVKRYRSITKEEIEQTGDFYNGADVMKSLTGFGTLFTCSLCRVLCKDKPGNPSCHKCIHSAIGSDDPVPCIEHYTYSNICEAENIDELYNAVQARADYIESLIKFVENGN